MMVLNASSEQQYTMANPQAWRLHIAKSRKLPDAPPGAYDSSAPLNEIEMSTSPESEPFKAQSRTKKGLGSITTLLNPHHRAVTPNGHEKAFLPYLDWSNLEGQGQACKADIESMCNAVRQQLLKHPSQDLPASFVRYVALLILFRAFPGVEDYLLVSVRKIRRRTPETCVLTFFRLPKKFNADLKMCIEWCSTPHYRGLWPASRPAG